jgi:hypothetical protein
MVCKPFLKHLKTALAMMALGTAGLHAAIDGPPIADNDYRLAILPTVTVGSARKVALGGAYVAVSEGVESLWENPAGAAYRRPRQTGRWGYDATLGSFLVDGDDIDNNGNLSDVHKRNAVVNVGGLLRYKGFGLGFFTVAQQYDVETPGGLQRFNFNVAAIDFAWRTRGQEFFYGLGIRPFGLEARPQAGGSRFLRLSGSAATAGVLWNPRRGPWRVGLSYAGSVKDDGRFPADATSTVVVEGLVLPREITIPVTAALGVSHTRRTGPAWEDRPLLLAAQIDVTGKTRDTVGIESFLEQKRQPTGRRVTLTPRAGAEWEFRPRRLRLRAGTYFEPSRFAGVPGRLHGTGGFQLRLFRFRFIGEHHVAFNYAVDGAARYFTQFFGLGFWAF